MLVRGAPRNRTQVKELVQLMIQVEQAPQRCLLLGCFDAAGSDILRLFMEECGMSASLNAIVFYIFKFVVYFYFIGVGWCSLKV